MNPNLRYHRPAAAREEKTIEAEVCIYGGSSAGVAAALQLRRMGVSSVILECNAHLGGLSAGGLSCTDIGNKAAIAGLSREFYQRAGKSYGVEEEWRFEPKVAEAIFNEWAQESQAPVYFRQFIASVEIVGARIRSLTTESGLKVRAQVFIDASYEGDLLARAGVSFHVGREDNAVYGETLNGSQVHDKHQFQSSAPYSSDVVAPVSPFVVEDDPYSGLLPGIEDRDAGPDGVGDHRVQAYNFRVCLTNDPKNQIAFAKPDGYDAREYVLLARSFAAGWDGDYILRKFDRLQNSKVDMNNNGPVSSDFIGRNHDFPNGDYARREQIFQAHVAYNQGLLWFLANDESVPADVRAKINGWGLPRDEFVETGGWPHQLYIRESRRMIGEYVMTEAECRGQKIVEDSISLAAYTMDSHNCRRFVRRDVDGRARVLNEGDVQEKGFPPYPISLRSILPRRDECQNLLVPVCLSTSHIAYGSIRMEPVFMILGQSAATVAALGLGSSRSLQDVPYADVRPLLERNGQKLEWTDQDTEPSTMN